MTNPIAEIADREFGSNEIMLGFKKAKLTQIAGQTKASNWQQHFKKVMKTLERE